MDYLYGKEIYVPCVVVCRFNVQVLLCSVSFFVLILQLENVSSPGEMDKKGLNSWYTRGKREL